MTKSLEGKVALVAGASRGIGKGVALQLGEAGATVYITGRTATSQKAPGPAAPGSLPETAQEIESRGGKAVAVACDHAKDADIERVFQQIRSEQGRLDILVNCAFSATNLLIEYYGKPFWKIPKTIWDDCNIVGLRSHYMAMFHAAQMMVPQKSGLIVNISEPDGKTYFFNPAFGAGKAALDRLSADCGLELKPHNVTLMSLWPSIGVRTETVVGMGSAPPPAPPPPESMETVNLGLNAFLTKSMADGTVGQHGESIEFPGKCVVALAQDSRILEKTGTCIMTWEVAAQYNILDIDGQKIQRQEY